MINNKLYDNGMMISYNESNSLEYITCWKGVMFSFIVGNGYCTSAVTSPAGILTVSTTTSTTPPIPHATTTSVYIH